MPAGQGEPPVPRAGAQPALGQRFHLCRHLAGLRLRRLRHRCLRPPHRRLAGQPHGHAGFVLDALEQAVHQRSQGAGLVHHSDRGSQYLSIKYTERWQRPASSPRSAASATAMTTPSPRRSTASSRPRSSTAVAHGAASTPSNTPPSNGSTGSTPAACWNPSETSRQPRPKPTSTQLWKLKPWPRSLNQPASGKPGAVHADRCFKRVLETALVLGRD
jgi:hypothetical protein